MNNIESNELLEMRQQLADLKTQLDSQITINERFLKEVISHKVNSIKRRAVIQSVLCIIFAPYCFYTFKWFGLSMPFCFSTFVLFMICLVGVLLGHYRLHRQDFFNGNLIAAHRGVLQVRKIHKNWHYITVPLLIFWILWGAYDIYTNVTQDKELLYSIGIGFVLGGCIGGIIGLRIHNKTLQETNELLKQIEELEA